MGSRNLQQLFRMRAVGKFQVFSFILQNHLLLVFEKRIFSFFKQLH